MSKLEEREQRESGPIPPKPKKQEPEPELSLPESKTDKILKEGAEVSNEVGKIELEQDAWQIFNVDNLPVLTEEQVQRFEKHLADKREVWIKTNMNKSSFPIRCRKLKNDKIPPEGQEPEFEVDKNGEPVIVIKNFKYTPISLYQRERIVTMTSDLLDLQRLAQALVLVKNVAKGIDGTDIKIDFESLPEVLRNENFTTIQGKLMKKQIEINRYSFKAYINMSDADIMAAYWGDVRDWLDVCKYKEQHQLGEWSGVM